MRNEGPFQEPLEILKVDGLPSSVRKAIGFNYRSPTGGERVLDEAGDLPHSPTGIARRGRRQTPQDVGGFDDSTSP